MTNFDHILFDLDGTLLDTSEGITKGVEYAIKTLGLKYLDYNTRALFIGPPLRDSFMKYCGVDAETVEDALAAYRTYYGTEGIYLCKPYDGMIQLLQTLKKNGKTLYVATAKPTDYSLKILKKWDMLKYFEAVVGASFDKSLDSKEKIITAVLAKIKSGNSLMIGDTYYDVEGARRNAIKAVGVMYGFGSRDELLSSKPDFLADNVSELRRLLLY